MILKSLEIQGFKSFPDKTRLSFGSGITAVVGPNGSGKSNISDAVRWVMGEQSTKALRGSRMEDVIFGGTKLRKPVGFAQVLLTVDNSDRSLDMESDEVTITRRLYRSGESEYRINGSGVRLRDVYELFMDTGLGKDGYSIIGQGRIAEIVGAKSAERREIFEEASGISKYRYRKNEAQRRLEQAQENLLRLRDILTELEDRVGPLKIQSEKAQAFLVLAAEKKQLEVSLYIRSLDKAREALRDQENRVMVCKAACDEVDDELSAMEADINAVFEQSQQCAIMMEQKRAQRTQLDEELSRREAQIAVLRNDIHHKTEGIERVHREIEANSLAVSDIAAQIEERMTLHGQKCALIEELKEQCAQSEGVLEDFLNDSARHNESLEAVNREMAALGAAISESRVGELTCTSSLEELAGRRARLCEQLDTKRADAAHYEKERADAAAFVSELDERIEAETNTVKGYAFKLEKRREKLELSERERNTLDLRIKEKNQNARLLEDLERSMEGFTASVKSVMRMASHGTLRGVLGPVSSLIEVPQRFTTAIETALAFALQNIVVEDEAAAKRAITQLKSQNAGRATFLPVSTIRGTVLDERPLKGQAGYVG
ncbi:MAG: chromosome segregation SMC family protein, partial [Acetanaerobacterium sp.]